MNAKFFVHTVNRYREYILALAPLLIMLPFGDGFYSRIDLIASMMYSLCLIVFHLRSPVLRQVPIRIERTYLVLVVYLALSIPFSIDTGHSLNVLFRYCTVYAVFHAMYSRMKAISSEEFCKILGVFAVVLVTVSYAVRYLPVMSSRIPSMNSVTSNFGHSHMSDLLLLMLPVVLYRAIRTRSRVFLLISATLLVEFFLTQARFASVIMVGIMAITYVVIRREISIPQKRLFAVVLVSLLFFIGVMNFRIYQGDWESTVRFPKEPINLAGRFEYWRQALLVFLNNPVIGTGAGTFMLSSQQFLSNSKSQTWFAHNFVLEILADTGIVGMMLHSVLIYQIARTVIIRQRAIHDDYFHILTVTLISFVFLGLFDYVFNYFVNTLLFTVILSYALMSVHKTSYSTSHIRETGYAFRIIIVVFSLITATNLIVEWYATSIKSTPPAIFLYSERLIPHSLVSFHTRSLRSDWIKTVINFHKGNANVYATLGEYAEKNNNQEEALEYYRKAMNISPKFERYYESFFRSAYSIHDYRALEDFLYRYAGYFLPDYIADSIVTTRLLTSHDIENIGKHLLVLVDHNLTHEARFARIFYAAGIYYELTDPEKTIRFWEAVQLLIPESRYIYLELAAMYASVGEYVSAKSAYERCNAAVSAQNQCGEFHPDQLSKPETYSRNILWYPYEGI